MLQILIFATCPIFERIQDFRVRSIFTSKTRLSRKNPVLSIAVPGRVLEVPTSPLVECSHCVQGVRALAVGGLRNDFS